MFSILVNFSSDSCVKNFLVQIVRVTISDEKKKKKEKQRTQTRKMIKVKTYMKLISLEIVINTTKVE